jgi:hypothetical protein
MHCSFHCFPIIMNLLLETGKSTSCTTILTLLTVLKAGAFRSTITFSLFILNRLRRLGVIIENSEIRTSV